MSEAIAENIQSPRRYRHRSRRRKMWESVGLMFGVPFLLFVVLALSVELIEYHPVAVPISSDASAVQPTAAGGMRTSGGMPSAVLKIPTISEDSLELR